MSEISRESVLFLYFISLIALVHALLFRYEPLNVEDAERLSIELCGPCCCYPVDDEEELPYFHREDNYHSPTPPNSMAVTARWGGSEAPIV